MRIKEIGFSKWTQAVVFFTDDKKYADFSVPREMGEAATFLQEAENAADFQPQLDRLLTAKRLFDEGYALLRELR